MSRFLSALLLLACFAPAHASMLVTLVGGPADGSMMHAPATVTMTAKAQAFADGEYIGLLELHAGSLGTVSGESPLPHTYTNLGPGTYTFFAKATNNWGQTAVSASRTITVVVPGGFPPTVTMGTPTGAPFIAPAAVGLSATAADSDGTITKVQFYAGSTLVGTDTITPYQVTWNNAAIGSYAVTAKATDNNNIVTTSAPINVTVTQSLVIGHIDGVGPDAGGTYRIRGWACSTGRDQPILVQVFAGGSVGTGTEVGLYNANQPSEAAVASACKANGTTYRFSIPLSAATRQQHANKKIYIHGFSPVGAPNSLIAGSGTFTIPAPLSVSRQYVYNAYEELCKVIEPETGSTVMWYDAAGNLAWSAAGLALPDPGLCNGGTLSFDSGRRVDRTYDARNRLKTLSFPDGRGNQTWTYTPDGLTDTIVTDNGGGDIVTNTYDYNKRRLMVQERLQWDIVDWPIVYGYDANGHLSSQTWHGLGVTYAPNALGQPTQAGTFATGVSYHPNGAIKQFTYGNQIVHTLTQNTRQLPDTSCDAFGACGAAAVLNDGYDYDANGNVMSISDGRTGNRGNRTMQYDDLDRLTITDSPMFNGVQVTYGYNGIDDLVRVRGVNRNQVYSYDDNRRLMTVSNATTGAAIIGLGYDVQGNLENKNGVLYDFDYGNRLRSVSGSPASTYVYDGHGRRVQDVAALPKHSQYTQSGQLAMTGDTQTVSEYIYLGGSLVAIRERNVATGVYTTKYQHTDALGSPVAVTNQARTVIENSEYEPYGKLLNRPLANGPGFTGHVLDAATGMNYMQQRYYDPGIGRFLSVDPVAARPIGDNFNRYWYANNNPYRFTDPDGRETGAGYATGQYTMAGESVSGPDAFENALTIVSIAASGGAAGLTVRGIFRAVVSRVAGDAVKNAADQPKGDLHAPGDVPDGATIVRGGSGEMPEPGAVFSGSQGGTVTEAAQGVPHGTIRTSTAGEVRAGGGQVQVAPEATRSGQVNGQHVNVTEGGKASTFSPPQPNPVPKVDRIK
jgi:RHS repeat-associated protein